MGPAGLVRAGFRAGKNCDSHDRVTENELDGEGGWWTCRSRRDNPQSRRRRFLDLLQAGSNRFGQRSASIIVIQRPHVGTTKVVFLDVGSFRCYHGRIIVSVEDSGRWIVDGSSDSAGIVPRGVAVLII